MKKARVYIDKQQDEIGDLNGYITEQINGEKPDSPVALDKNKF